MNETEIDICNPTGHVVPGSNSYIDAAWVVAAICVIVSCVLTFRLIYLHLKSFHKPKQQKHIIRILLMVPIYAIDSWLSFRFYWLSVYFDLFRDIYEAVVIYEFYALLVEYTGGYEATKNAFEKRSAFKLVVPLCCWEVHPRRGMLRWLSRLTLQYVVLNPVTAIIAVILQAKGRYCDGQLTNFSSGYPYISFIIFISVTVAMYALVLFYVVAKDELKEHNPVPKFLSIKFIIMLSFWQSLVVAGLVKISVIHETAGWSTDNIASGIQDALICVEMLIVAVWHLFAFQHKEFEGIGAEETTNIWKSLYISLNYWDVFKEIYNSFFYNAVHSIPIPKYQNKKSKEEKLVGSSSSSSSSQTIPPFAPTSPPGPAKNGDIILTSI